MPPGHGFAGRLSSAPNSLARSLEAGGGGVDEAASLARARLQLQQRQLRATEQYRHEHRQERLTRLLQGSAQLTRYIYPHYGSVEFVELPFRNPYSTEHAFTVVWDDPMGVGRPHGPPLPRHLPRRVARPQGAPQAVDAGGGGAGAAGAAAVAHAAGARLHPDQVPGANRNPRTLALALAL
eukprot:scaffold32644_cov47-Phaeocystis_antarctica.AAC.1